MYDLRDFFAVLDGIAPIKYSYALIEKGDYDNSGIIVAQNSEIKRVLFSLDLSVGAVKRAKNSKCDTIVTHHPAIYHPLKTLDGENAALLSAVNGGLNVISMHLNLDVAKGGVDESLAAGLGGANAEILDP
ncbi:MAG: Nif3-like dinuclear metal center hexameric protein, partial [Clostridia bacterium]|nr:Nif3-like dinuclear metal center hexameric protein [Clostridia bacterium]